MTRDTLTRLLFHHGERKLLLLLLLLGGALFGGRRLLMPEPREKPAPTPEMPPPQQLLPWREQPPFFLTPIPVDQVGDPFLVGFPMEKPKQPAAAAPAIVSEPPAPEPPPPPPPPKRKVAVTFRGVRTALTGKVYAMLEISYSEEGASSVFLQQGAPLAFGPSVHAVTEEALTLEFPETGKQATIPYGETEIFTLEPKP